MHIDRGDMMGQLDHKPLLIAEFAAKFSAEKIFTIQFYLFLSFLFEWHTLPSHASAEACLTGWPNAQPHESK